ncbi:MAG: DEAD/DEAH box helicase, partial [Acholeplasmatales bacterium]|nr:DEAD/DEAH box helicase [Acholeplasmatales bacterium]
MQTYKVAQHIASFSGEEINIKVYTGGTDRERELSSLKFRQPQIIIATPGKLKDLVIDENALDIHTAKLYIIDEVDMTLASGFEEEMDQITDILKSARMMVFSAT